MSDSVRDGLTDRNRDPELARSLGTTCTALEEPQGGVKATKSESPLKFLFSETHRLRNPKVFFSKMEPAGRLG